MLGCLPLLPALASARSSDSRLVRLSLNENPMGPSKNAKDEVRKEMELMCRYPDRVDLLTETIAAREQVANGQIVLGEILAPLGLHLALTSPVGSEFLYSAPGYTALIDAVAPGGGTTVAIPLNDRLENDLPAISARVSAQTRAVYIVNPHNPSGTVSQRDTFLEFVREVSKRTTVIVDEAYLEFEPDFQQRTAVGLTRAGDNVIVFRTFSKIYGLAGMAIGYAVAPKAYAGTLKRAGMGATTGLDRFAIAAALGSLQDAEYVSSIRRQVTAEREKWHRLLDRLNVRHSDSRGNFVFFDAGRPQVAFSADLRSKGVDIGRGFAPLDNWARISLGLPSENDIARNAVADLLR
ncbi:aminotransferase class I/II-fold pyridoxal phosphate-dependent enzyme [Bradyrhizobium lablabi]|nr:aminotransferase class I/II-fold pyridoxal phosphate-dependent enzyme [Bradyrhizobium lablabi]